MPNLSGKKPILTISQSIPRIHALASTLSLEPMPDAKPEPTKPGYYKLFADTYDIPQVHSTQITIEPALAKEKEAEQFNFTGVPTPTGKLQYSYHQPLKAIPSFASRLAAIPNLTHDRPPSKYDRTCTKSVHKVVFLFCSVTLAIIIACVIFVEMKQMQEESGSY